MERGCRGCRGGQAGPGKNTCLAGTASGPAPLSIAGTPSPQPQAAELEHLPQPRPDKKGALLPTCAHPAWPAPGQHLGRPSLCFNGSLSQRTTALLCPNIPLR